MTERTNEITPKQSQAKIVKQRRISIVWFVPLIALIFGTWLGLKAYSEQGTFINIEFESARGIIANKTEVRHKGLVAGVVRSIQPSANLQHVIAEVEMSEKFSSFLTKNTLFWLVTADVSLQGVSGLDTLISGDYIKMKPDMSNENSSEDSFVALSSSPPLDVSTPGLHVILQSRVLGSINIDSPVSYNQIPIGYVSGYKYVEASNKVDLSLFIEPKYAHLVKENSQFWNSSGVQVIASITSGIKVNTDSLASIIAGGISVGTLPFQEPSVSAQNGQRFDLHTDYQAAEMGHEIELILGWNSGIDRGAVIVYQGVTIGVVESFTTIDPRARNIIAKAKVNPRIVPYLTDESQFYIVSPTIDLSGVSNAHSLLKGTYITIRPSLVGKTKKSFSVYHNKPAYKYTEPGRHLILESNTRESLQAGSSIYYKQQPVGTVQAIETVGADKHLIHLHIKEDFQDYVTTDSHFWNTSGLSIKGGIQGFEFKAQSMKSVLSGGIAFDRGLSQKPITANNGDKFQLYSNASLAKQRLTFTLVASSDLRITPQTRIMHRGLQIGAVHQITDSNKVRTLTVGIQPEYQYILTKKTQFWLVKSEISLSGLSDTDALFSGAYITFNTPTNENDNASKTPSSELRNFVLADKPPEKHSSAAGLQLQLITEHASVATPGSPISYKGIVVGQVDNVLLHQNAKTNKDHILVNITIHDKHRALVNNSSRFYNASGISISGDLTGFMVKSESVDAMLRGGISFYNLDSQHTQNNKKATTAVAEKTQFTLYKHHEQAQNAGLSITIAFDDNSGLKVGTKVTYQQQNVGRIERLIFNPEQVGVTAVVLLNDQGSQFATAGTKFWFAESVVGLVGSKNVSALLSGGFIGVLPAPQNNSLIETEAPKAAVASITHFIAENMPPIIEALPYGLNLKLIAEKRGSVRTGNPVLYRQVKVGEVIGIGLADTADKVNIFININKHFIPLVTSKSRFWNTSGITIKGGLFNGVNIHSESVETLLSGGIAFATPENDDGQAKGTASTNGHEFYLHGEPDEDWLEWQPKIQLTNVDK